MWEGYYKFCFDRNPWDRIISSYYWHCGPKPQSTLSEFIRSDKPLTLKKRGYELYTIDGKVAVDKICKFENLTKELEEIRVQLGIPEKLNLPWAKPGIGKDQRSYRDIIGEEDRDRISELFRFEINLLGYEW